MDRVDVDRLLARLAEFDALRDSDTVNRTELERVKPSYADGWPPELNPAVRQALEGAGIARPYQHQIDAVTESLRGSDVVLESPTASGKTLSFTAPMLHALKESPGSHAMMVYPMKALAFDQREQIRTICQPLGIESWPYDGDTEDEDKAVLRQHPAHIMLTNPEYLNMSVPGQSRGLEQTL